MKFHLNKEQCYENFLARTKTPRSEASYAAFVAGWYAAGTQINEGEDSDWLQERLYEEDFLEKEAEEIHDY